MKREKRVRIIEVKHARELTRKLRGLAGRPKRSRAYGVLPHPRAGALTSFEMGKRAAFREAARMIDALPRVRKRMGRVSR